MSTLSRRLFPLVALLLAFVALPAFAQHGPGGHGGGDDVEVDGPIEALGDFTVTVGGYTFAVTEATDIHGDHDEPLTFADLSVGLDVEADGFYDADSLLIASEIEVDDEDGGPHGGGHGIEAEGLVTARSESSLTVGGLTFAVTDATVVEGDDDQPATFDDIVVGLRVEVRGAMTGAGALVATRIEIEDDHDGGPHGGPHGFEVEGLIEALSADALTVRGRTFVLTDSTRIYGDDHQPATVDDLAVGLRVEVRAALLADSSLVALRIEIEDFDDDGHAETTGAIEAIGDASLTVGGTLFAVTDQTVVLDDDRQPIEFATLVVGQTVEVRSVAGADGGRVATRIKLEDGQTGDREIDVHAALDAVTDSVAVVLGRPFVVTARTRVLGLDGTPVALTDLATGAAVEIHAGREADGTLVAFSIRAEDHPADAVRLRADVTAVSSDSLSVLGVAFDASGATVTGANGEAITLADLLVGQTVEVTGTATADGVVATAVRVRRGTHVAGRVASVSGTGFALPGVSVATTSATLFVDERGTFVAPSTVASGATVRVFGTATAAGVEASRVVVLDPSSVVAGEAAPDAAFALEAPYPNPATTGATLAYTLGTSASVQLAVYDALGRVVQRVDAGAVGAGRHEARLDTARLPAGVYLVRLTTDGAPTATQRLTVVR